MVVYMACKMRCRWLTFRRCFVNRALSRNSSLRDAKPARHLFVWFAKHCLAEHCLSFRGDADECKKQFCFVFRICLAFFDSGLWRPLATSHFASHVHNHVTWDRLLIGCFTHVSLKTWFSNQAMFFFCFGVTQTRNRKCAKPFCFLILVSCFLTLVCGGPYS